MMGKKKVFTLEQHKLAKMGPDYVVLVPRKIIKYKVIDPTKIYNIHFEEVPEKDDEQPEN